MSSEENFLEEGVSVVMPCLNEEKTVGLCVREAKEALQKNSLPGEVVVVDNGSSDRSVQLAEEAGARVVRHSIKGYGNAYLKGIESARYPMVVIGDSDSSYDFNEIPKFVEKLSQGFDLVMGNRFKGGIESNAMPWHHKYIGNPILSGLVRAIFKTPVSDCHCGMRAFKKAAFEKMNCVTGGMEFASEIVIKSALLKLKICEIPVKLRVDGRDRPPHLRSFRDGWRHLRYILSMSPGILFQIPSFIMILIGMFLVISISSGPINIGFTIMDFQMMMGGGILLVLGVQLIFFDLLIKRFALYAHLKSEDSVSNFILRHFSLEKGLIVGGGILLAGVVISATMIASWIARDFTFNNPRYALWALLLLCIGLQTIASSFLLSMFDLNTHYEKNNEDIRNF